MFGASTPTPPAPPPPPPNAPTMADSKVQGAGANERARAAGGLQSTIKTTPGGVAGPANTPGKSLLGQ